MFLDIDKFKTINDTLGHDVGDELLKIVAQRLHGSIHAAGTVCRLGGDEFIVLLENPRSIDTINDLAERCCLAIAAPVSIKDHRFSVTTSIGISIYPGDGLYEETLIKRADLAMYFSKKSGGNRYTLYNDKLDIEQSAV